VRRRPVRDGRRLHRSVDQKQALASFQIRMTRPPNGNASVLFYPGDLYRVDRESVATQVLARDQVSTGHLTTIDRLDSIRPPTSAAHYSLPVEFSPANAADLQGAIDYLRSVNVGTVGIYALAADWEAIVGAPSQTMPQSAPFSPLPNWRPGARSAADALDG